MKAVRNETFASKTYLCHITRGPCKIYQTISCTEPILDLEEVNKMIKESKISYM